MTRPSHPAAEAAAEAAGSPAEEASPAEEVLTGSDKDACSGTLSKIKQFSPLKMLCDMKEIN